MAYTLAGRTISKVAVIGSGQIGPDIAFYFSKVLQNHGVPVIVVDVDRPTGEHGIPPDLLFCEFDQLGFRLVEFVRKPELAGYYAQFEATGERPEPYDIEPCRQPGDEEDDPPA